MNREYPRSKTSSRFRRRMEERITEVRHRLAMEEACNGTAISGAANVPGFLEIEEELLGEAAELERILAAGESVASTP